MSVAMIRPVRPAAACWFARSMLSQARRAADLARTYGEASFASLVLTGRHDAEDLRTAHAHAVASLAFTLAAFAWVR